jgi:lipopolysaccharide heptosyltransferase II
MKKFLVIQTAFTGDVVLATAIVEKLHHYFPQAQIDFLLRKGNEELLENHPFLHKVLIWNKKENKNRNLFALLKKIRKTKYDAVINMQRFASTGILTAFSQAREKIGFDKNPLSFLFTKKVEHNMTNDRHEVERNNDLIAHLTDNTLTKPRLYPSEKNYAEVKDLMATPYICITPASVWFTKQYPAGKWIEFINSLPPNLVVYLLGGKTDISLCEMIKEKTEDKQVGIQAGKLSFLSSAALMEKAVMNYTNDSAPLHFASATDAPVAAIFCSTIPAFGYYPLSGKSFIIETKEKLSCRPCSLHGKKACPLGHFKCAYTVQNSQLLDALE